MTDPLDQDPGSTRERRRRVLVTLRDEYVSPRFDLTTEVLVVDLLDDEVLSERTVVLPEASAEALCHLVISDGIDEVICGAMEEEYHQYLTWKRVLVVDSVVAMWEDALAAHRVDRLCEGDVLFQPPGSPVGG